MKMPVSEEGQQETVNYQQKYKTLKRKLKFLIYEHECFQEELHKAQRKLLKISRDKSFLLDRLLQYEKIENSTTDSEATASSDSEIEIHKEGTPSKKKKIIPSSLLENLSMLGNITYPSLATKQQSVAESTHAINETPKKRNKSSTKTSKHISSKGKTHGLSSALAHGDGHMTSEEIEKHLESRHQLIDLLPEKAPPTVPKELFSNEPSTSLDRLKINDATKHAPGLLSGNIHYVSIDKSEPNEATGGDSSPSNFEDSYADDDSLVIDLPE